MTLSERTRGCNTQAAIWSGRTKVRAQRKGLCTAAVFGVISQKIRTMKEIRIVASSSPQVSEKRKASTVAMLEATITATLLTTRFVERKVLGSESSFSI